MEVRFDVKMTQKIMYNFLLNHTYRSISGVVGMIFGILSLGIFVFTMGNVPQWQSTIYLVFGIWFLVYLPISLYLRSAKQVKLNPVFKKPITYVINEEGIATIQDDQKALIQWEDLLKVTETRMSLLAYTGTRYSFVLPKEAMGDQCQIVKKMLREHVDAKKIKIKER